MAQTPSLGFPVHLGHASASPSDEMGRVACILLLPSPCLRYKEARRAETEMPSVWGTMRMMVVIAVPPVLEWNCQGPSVYTGEEGQCPYRAAATCKPAGCPGHWLWDAFSQCRSGGRSVSRELSPKAECCSECWCPCPVLSGTEEQEGCQPTTTAPRVLRASGWNKQKPSDADRLNRGKPRCWTSVRGGGGSVCFLLVPTCVLWAPRQEEKGSFWIPSGEAAMGQALSWTMVTAVSGWCKAACEDIVSSLDTSAAQWKQRKPHVSTCNFPVATLKREKETDEIVNSVLYLTQYIQSTQITFPSVIPSLGNPARISHTWEQVAPVSPSATSRENS